MKKTPVSRPRHALGGTLIGFVAGLLVGLGAALAVAVYVTKVPVPFVDRGLSRDAGADAKEAERNKGWNPNAAATRTPGAAPAAPAVPAGSDASAGAVSVPPADGKPLPAPAAAPAAGGKTPTDPLGDLMQQRAGQAPAAGATTPPTAAAAPGLDPFNYFVQAGAFRTPEDAETQRAKLAMMGIDAQVSEREQNGRTVYRVRVGPFTQKALAELTQEQLNVNGVESALVRVQR